ncbi:MAG: hypothetical protein ABI824_11120 [Acidobacteriota bacterium]
MTAERLANTFAVCAGFSACFQFALAGGAPWGRLTWGGKFPGRLPARMRIVAAFAAVLLLSFAVIVQVRTGVIATPWQPISRKLIWIVVAYGGLGAVANAITPSRWERIVWLPVVIALLVTSLLIATG